MRIPDPLATARLYLQLNPNTAQNRAIRELLAALADPSNAQPLRDETLFQGELGQLTAALLDARQTGLYSAEQWHNAARF